MISFEEAQLKAAEFIQQLEKECRIPLALVPEATHEKSVGWLFYYNSVEFLRTREISSTMVGNGPILVDRDTGDVTQLGTAFPPDYYLDQYIAKAHK